MNEDPELAAEAFRSGASAYLLKRSAASELTTAIREVMNGRSYVTPLMTQRHGGFPAEEQRHGEADLTPAATGSAAVARGRAFDEGGRQPAESHAADRRIPQVRNDEAAQRQLDGGADSICRQTPHRLTWSRVLLVDDNEAMLARAAAVLTPACEVVGIARTGPRPSRQPGPSNRT